MVVDGDGGKGGGGGRQCIASSIIANINCIIFFIEAKILYFMKSDSDGVLSTSTKTTSLWLLSSPPISARRRRTCWRTISSALSDFENPARIMAHGTLNLDTSCGLEDPDADGRIDLLLMRGSLP